MYASIYKYAREHNLTPLQHRAYRIPSAYICIDHNGVYERLDIVPKSERVKRIFPDIGKNRAASGTNANMICNKKEYIFCIPDGKGGYTGNIRKHTGWMAITEEGSAFSSTLHSIWQFCRNVDENLLLHESIVQELELAGIKKGDFVSFRIDGRRAEEAIDWEEWFDLRMNNLDILNRTDVEKGISLLTGQLIIPIQGEEKFPQIMTSQTGTGSPIYSCAHKTIKGLPCAFTSYGIVNSLGSPMSIDEAETIKAGLEYLLGSEKNHNDYFNIIYWFDQDHTYDLIDLSINGCFEDDDEMETLEEEPENAYTRLLNAVRCGQVPDWGSSQGKYHIIHYEVPAKGRFFLDAEKNGDYSELYKNLFYWYSDSAVTLGYRDHNSGTYVSKQRYLSKLYGILFGLLDHKDVKDKFKEIRNEYGINREQLLNAIHENRQIPSIFYDKAIRQTIRVYRLDSSSDEGKKARQESNWPMPIQIIKVFLIRNGRETYRMDALDLENASSAYNCGRLLATIDRLQQISAENKINLSVGQKYFKSASRMPGKILTLALSNEENYLKKLKNNGTKIFFIRLLGELSEKIGNTFPDKFSKIEQGEFMLGYFYQSKEFYKKEDSINSIVINENDKEEDE